jgi:hypothetical protein
MLIAAAAGFSLLMLYLLWRGDPKRRRIAGLRSGKQPVHVRRLLVLASLLPGACIALSGDASAFLIWLGICAIGGWLIAQLRLNSGWRPHIKDTPTPRP